MKTYLKSLFPWRWLALVSLMIPTSLLMVLMGMTYEFQISNILFWVMCDITIGIGRSEKNLLKNLIGVFIVFGVMTYLFLIYQP